MSRKAGFDQRVYVIAQASISDASAVTEAEIGSATEISADLPSPINFAGTTNSIDISNVASRQDQSILGTFDPGDINFEVYRDTESGSEQAFLTLTDESEFYLIKFEKSIAGSDPAAGDTYDIAPVVVGTKADVESGRNEARRALVPCFVNGDIERDKDIVS